MTPEVLNLLSQLQKSINALDNVVLLSPSRQEREFFPKARVLTVKDWDLNLPKPELRADLVLACHVFHYSKDPELWLRNITASCRALLFVDLIQRKRSATEEWGADGDCMRYAIGAHQPTVPKFYDLNTLGERLLAHTTFDGGRNEYGEALHFLALVQGQLGQPLLRVDDYPTGVRPILKDLNPLHQVLEQFEQRDLSYHLGIVPAITTPDMFQTLRKFPKLVTAQHGYDHKYPQYSALLERKGDLNNSKGTVGGFNEFAWHRYSTVERKLSEGKTKLQTELQRDVNVYIPPCNRCDRTTARALKQLGFGLCLSEKPAPGGYVPTLGSNFYGRSNQFKGEQLPEVIGLHATWEADLWQAGERDALPRLLDQVLARTQNKREQVQQLASEVSRMR